MNMRPATEVAFRNVLNTFSGADGGVSFCLLRTLVEAMDERAAAGDTDADKVLEVIHQLSRMINLAQRRTK